MLDRVAFADRPVNARSKVTNGSRLHQKGTTDGRSRESRRFADLCASFAAELGGAAQSEAARTLIRNAAALALRSEQLQADTIMGRAVDPEEMVRLAHASARLLSVLRRTAPPPAPEMSFAEKLRLRHERGAA